VSILGRAREVSSMRRLPLFVAATAVLAFILPLGTGSATTTTSSNLLSGDTATFDGGTGGWAAFTSGVSLSRVSSPVQAGTGALRIRNDSANTVDAWVGSGGGPASWTPAQPDSTYTATAFVRAATTARTLETVLVFFDRNATNLGASWAQPVTDASGGWTATTPVVGLAPPNTAYVLAVVIAYGTSPGETHYLDSVSLTGTAGTQQAVAGPLHTTGNQIIDRNNQPLVLRGVMTERAEYSTAEVPTDASIAGIRRWRANFVRVPLAESLWLNTCPDGAASNDPAYPAAIDAAVKSITSRGMVAMVSLTNNTITPCGPSGPNQMADANYSIPFWQQVAARYASNGLVVFDLYNEPHDISDSTWLLGGPVDTGTTTFVAAGMQQMYDAVRTQAPNNLVFVAGPHWAATPSSTSVSGTNIVNSVHVYTCPNHVPPGCPYTNVYDPSQIMDRWDAVATTSPVMITEFGWPDNGDGVYNRNVVDGAEARGWGWTAFAWVPTSGLFKLNADPGPAFEPTPAGQPILAGLARN
jgi:endoglucanase